MKSKITTANARKTWQTINGLTLENFGTAPFWLKALVLLLLSAFILVAGWFFLISPVILKRQSLVAQESDLISQYAQKYAKAKQLKAIETQTQALNGELSGVLETLPSTFNMNSLVEQIHATAMRTGVQVEDIKTGAQVEMPMFFERGMTLVLLGDYHQLGRMMAGLSDLPVALTFHDFEMVKIAQNQGKSQIRLTLQAKTYRTKSKKEQEKGADHANP